MQEIKLLSLVKPNKRDEKLVFEKLICVTENITTITIQNKTPPLIPHLWSMVIVSFVGHVLSSDAGLIKHSVSINSASQFRSNATD